MGFAASQARLIVLTQRKSDLELRMQQISNAEMMLAMQSEEVATEYTRKLSNQTMKVTQGDGTTVALTAAALAGNNLRVVDQSGQVVFGKGSSGDVDTLGAKSNTVFKVDYTALKAKLMEDTRFEVTKTKTHAITEDCYEGEGDDKALKETMEFNDEEYTYDEGARCYVCEYTAPDETLIDQIIAQLETMGGTLSESVYQSASFTIPGEETPIFLSEFFTDEEDSPITSTVDTPQFGGTGYDRGSEVLAGIKSGKYILQKQDENGNWVTAAPDSNVGVSVGYNTADDAAAEAEYNAKTAAIQVKEKRLQTEMVQVQSQQKACETEIESVKKLVEKNTEQIFKYYN